MNNNILICLLFILIAYTIFKILSNTCNGFSVGGVGGDEDQCPEYIQDIISKCCHIENNCSIEGYPKYCDINCSKSIHIFRDNCSNTLLPGTATSAEPLEISIKESKKIYDNIIDKSCKKTCSNKG